MPRGTDQPLASRGAQRGAILPLMAKRPLPNRQIDFENAPSDVQVTVFLVSDDRGLRRWLERHRERILASLEKVAVAVVVAIVGAMFAVAFGIGRSGGAREVIRDVREAGPAGVAAAYGYPPGCLRVRISAVNPAYARADFDRPGLCGYSVEFPSALFHRFDGEWHPVLYTVSYPCPVPSVPAPVQSQLSLCPRHGLS
jgi:hypothetical protein